MRIQLSTRELRRLLPVSPGDAAHCRRVAALSWEVASRLPLSWKALNTLEHAALLHHTPAMLLDARAMARFLPDVAPETAAGPGAASELPEDLETVLDLFHGEENPDAGRTHCLLAGVLVMADAIDQQFESLVWEPRPVSRLWAEVEELSALAGDAVWKAARAALQAPHRLPDGLNWDLPVHAPVVREVVAGLCTNPDCDVPYLARLASKDAALAGNVLSTANSAWFGRRSPVRSVSQALAYIGADEGRRVLLAMALKPLYGSSRLSTLWRHSIEMAGFCESLAWANGFLKPAEALMLGLVHDVGRVALLRHAGSGSAAVDRLKARQCPLVYSEQIVFGADHGEIGAGILTSWGLPADLIAAVRHHHWPADSDSAAAAALYLAEFWMATDEDLPSVRHLDWAQRRLGCSLEMLAQVSRARGSLSNMLNVA